MPQTPAPADNAVAIIGGGWAGLACALKLAQAGYQPVVFESAPEPGGRARRALIEGHYRDNGHHLMLNGCVALTKLFDVAGIKLPTVSFAYQSGARQLSVPANAGQFGLVLALLRAKGFSWQERIKLITALLHLKANDWCVPDDLNVSDWLRQRQQPAALIDNFWAPLALAILNTPLDQAAMRRLAPVLRDTLAKGGNALCMLQPENNLSDSIVAPLLQTIDRLGGTVHCGERVTAVEQAGTQFQLRISNRNDSSLFDHVVLAVPPWSLNHLTLPALVNATAVAEAFGAQPIATVYLGFDSDFRLPTPLFQIAGPTADDARVWAMDRAHCGEPGVVAISISAQGPWCQLTADALAESALSALLTNLTSAPIYLWKKAVVVQRATYAATPQAVLKPTSLEPLPRLHLAGDWTHADYPATLEAAVASGFAAAKRITRQHT